MVDCVRVTVCKEGWLALYKGLGASVLYGAPYVGAQMSCYELYQRLFTTYIPGSTDPVTGIPTIVSKLAAGACTGVTAQTLVFPMNTVRTRLQVNGIGGKEKLYTGLGDCMVQIFKTEGILGFYKGCGANNARMVPNGMIQFAAFDFFKNMFMGKEEPIA
jgi:solute carrier family 25 phosphate transporter 23/24/25/41